MSGRARVVWASITERKEGGDSKYTPSSHLRLTAQFPMELDARVGPDEPEVRHGGSSRPTDHTSERKTLLQAVQFV
jgi:hypothetical protein